MNNEKEQLMDELSRQTSPYPGNQSSLYETNGEPTLGELLVGMSADLSTLVRKEIELAQSEFSEKFKKATGGLINIGLGASFILLGVGALIASAILWLGPRVGYGLSALLVGVLVVVLGVILAKSGQTQLQSLTLLPEKSLASLKKDTEMVKEKLQ